MINLFQFSPDWFEEIGENAVESFAGIWSNGHEATSTDSCARLVRPSYTTSAMSACWLVRQ